MVDFLKMKSRWNEIMGKPKLAIAYLKGKDLIIDEEKSAEIKGNQQIKLGRTEEEMKKIISGFILN